MDPGCPAWCSTGFDHLDEMLDLDGAYWHRGDTITVATDDTSVDGDHVAVDVRLEKFVMDGGESLPAVVFVGAAGGADGFSYRPDQARLLAGALLDVSLNED